MTERTRAKPTEPSEAARQRALGVYEMLYGYRPTLRSNLDIVDVWAATLDAAAAEVWEEAARVVERRACSVCALLPEIAAELRTRGAL